MFKRFARRSIERSVARIPSHGYREDLGDGQYVEAYAKINGHTESRVLKGSLGMCVTRVTITLGPETVSLSDTRRVTGVSYVRDADVEGDPFELDKFEDKIKDLSFLEVAKAAVECRRVVRNAQESSVPQEVTV